MAKLAPWLNDSLARLLRQRGHAWLLTGTKGLGQLDLAVALAASWLCEQPIEDDATEPSFVRRACGTCESCALVRAHSHPDMLVLLPEVLSLELGYPLDQKTQDDLDDKKRKPSRQIKLEAIQGLINFTQRTSSRGKGLVVVIYPSEAMNLIAANALLKSLEEPAGHCRFVLATEGSAALLPTIRSRCQIFALTSPQPETASSWLIDQGVAAPDAPVWLSAAGGQPQTALNLAQSGMSTHAWLNLPKQIASGVSLAQLPAAVVEAPLSLATTLQKICHDTLCHVQGAKPRYFSSGSLPTAPNGPLAVQASVYKLTGWAKSLTASMRVIEHPVKPDLMMEAMLAEAKLALQSKESI